MFPETNAYTLPMREQIGDHHYTSCVFRDYQFPVSVFQMNEDGSRALVRIEAANS